MGLEPEGNAKRTQLRSMSTTDYWRVFSLGFFSDIKETAQGAKYI